ncbi:MAG: oligoribonuclease [Pseudomonadales bacterium]
MTKKSQNLIWMDLEMTGLDPESNRILEIATLVTDADLNLIAEGPVLCIRQSDELLSAMDKWNTKHHTASGLLDRVRQEGISEAEAEAATLAFLQEHTVSGKSPLCGNSIGQDRRFLVKYMPELASHLHYRNLDVSTIKELAKRWKPKVAKGLKKQNNHRAMDDIKESIRELEYYREHFFNLS